MSFPRHLPAALALLLFKSAFPTTLLALPPLVSPSGDHQAQLCARRLAEQFRREARSAETFDTTVSLLERTGLADSLSDCRDSLFCLFGELGQERANVVLFVRLSRQDKDWIASVSWFEVGKKSFTGSEEVLARTLSGIDSGAARICERAVAKARSRYARLPSPAAGGTALPTCKIPAGNMPREFFIRKGSADRGRRTYGFRAFQAARTEVTRSQYQACMESGACTPAHYADGACERIWEDGTWVPGFVSDPGPGSRLPVQCVDWIQARDFCTWSGGSLPSQMQWEYMARAGDTGAVFWPTDTSACRRASIRDLSFLKGRGEGWDILAHCDDGYPGLAPAGSFPPNRFGLQDIDGNLREWVLDASGPFFLAQADSLDPRNAPAEASWRLSVGISFQSIKRIETRYDNRNVAWFGSASSGTGFRCVYP